MKTQEPRDEIIAEVRAIRDQIAARFDYDVDRLYEEAKRQETKRHKIETGRKILEPSPKKLHIVTR